MPGPTPTLRSRLSAAALAAMLLAGGCGVVGATSTNDQGATISESTDSGHTEAESAVTTTSTTATAGSLFDSTVVHDISVDFDQDDYDEMIVTYETTGEKDWIEATVTIDGTTFEDVGVRLKGNSSLFSVTSETAGSPEQLPWLISLDKYVDDQNYQGYFDIVIRSNSTETAMNEAVALELLGAAGLATEEAIATGFTVNGGVTELRLAIEHPDAVWEEANFDDEQAALYKADSEGDYSYRGDDPDSYEDVFNQKVGEDDLEPLMEFLDFINNSDDATFAAELENWLDVDAFATYLAFQDLIQNGDDIDGRGNNSYLHYSYDDDQFTVVSWDLNLAFNTANIGGGGGGRQGPGQARLQPGQDAVEQGEAPVQQGRDAAQQGQAPTQGAAGSRPAAPGATQGAVGSGGTNVLSSRFLETEAFHALYAEATTELTASLFTSGEADAIVAAWVDVLSSDAADLVASTTVDGDAAAIVATFPAS